MLCSLLLPSSARSEQPEHIRIALSQVGVTERGGNNRGPQVEMYLRAVGLGPGYAWCAAFVSWVLDSAKVMYPTKRTAGARAFISERSVSAQDVIRGRASVDTGYWLAIWRNGNSWAGHIGPTLTWSGIRGRVIEGNTSSGNAGSQRDGGGVYVRSRAIEPRNRFRITHFEPVIPRPTITLDTVRPVIRITEAFIRSTSLVPGVVPHPVW